MEPIRIILADDHPLFRAALRAALAQLLPQAVVVEAAGIEDLRHRLVEQPSADLVLLDLRMPGVQGFSSLIELRASHPALPIIVVSGSEDAAVIRRTRDFGAAGFVPKSADLAYIGAAVRKVLDGDLSFPEIAEGAIDAEASGERELARKIASLTPQQLRVMTMLADGRLNKQIAGDLDVTEATIKAHVTAILRKLGLYRRTQAAVVAQRLIGLQGSLLPVSADGAEDGAW